MDSPRRPDADRAVDDREARLEQLDVPGRLADEVRDLVGEADVHQLHGPGLRKLAGVDVDAGDGPATALDQLEERSPDLSETHDY